MKLTADNNFKVVELPSLKFNKSFPYIRLLNTLKDLLKFLLASNGLF